MRYALLIVDGAADYPQAEFAGKTPLEVADNPAFDRLAREGFCGRAQNIPTGMAPGSDVAALSILGYAPSEFYTGRAPLEAAAQKIELSPTETVFRANTVILRDGVMADFAGGHPHDKDVFPLIDYLHENLNIPGLKLFRGVSYRHLCVIDGLDVLPTTTPPHDISGQKFAPYLPVSEMLNRVMERSEELLKKIGEPFTRLWLWGGGKRTTLPKFSALFNRRGAMISAVDLLRGVATLAGLEIISVEGATGFYDTNYRGKGEAALEFLRGGRDNLKNDFVVVHVEAPDEAAHNGDGKEKVRAIENFSRHIVEPLIAEAERSGDLRIALLPDHYTPLNLRTHSAEPVPFVIWGAGVSPRPAPEFTESAFANFPVIPGVEMIRQLLKGN